MLFGSSSVVGLDIGATSIKLVELEKGKSDFTLKTFGFIPTPPGSISGGDIIDPGSLSQAIRSLVNQSNVKTTQACTAIWGSAVITKRIAIPRVDEAVLPEQLRFEAEQYIPFDINEINLGYDILREVDSSPEQMNLLLVAAKRDFVLRFAEVIEGAGLQCGIVDVAGFALANCFEANYGKIKGQSIILLNVGASLTQFVVVENGQVVFCRDLNVGGLSFTSDIQKTLGLSWEEAESLKISASSGQSVPKEASDVLTSTCESVSEEVRRSYDFFLSQAGEARVSQIYVTGGGIGTLGLGDHIKKTMGMAVEPLNPFKKVTFGKQFKKDFIQQVAPYVSVGLGLAMRSTKDI